MHAISYVGSSIYRTLFPNTKHQQQHHLSCVGKTNVNPAESPRGPDEASDDALWVSFWENVFPIYMLTGYYELIWKYWCWYTVWTSKIFILTLFRLVVVPSRRSPCVKNWLVVVPWRLLGEIIWVITDSGLIFFQLLLTFISLCQHILFAHIFNNIEKMWPSVIVVLAGKRASVPRRGDLCMRILLNVKIVVRVDIV